MCKPKYVLCATTALALGSLAAWAIIDKLVTLGIERKPENLMEKLPELSGSAEELYSVFFSDEFKERKKKTDEWLKKNSTELYMDAFDKTWLFSRFVKNEGSNKYVIACHGYGISGMFMSTYAEKFYDLGFNLLIPDARGHGSSGGLYVGMGWPERHDIKGWINRILRMNPNAEIVLFGVSMGATTVLNTAGESLPKAVKAVIADSGFSSISEQIAFIMKTYMKLPPFPVLPLSAVTIQKKAGYNIYTANTVNQVKKSSLPLLLIHGDKDKIVPCHMLFKLFKSAKSDKKDFLIVEGAGHLESEILEHEIYWNKITSFLKKYL
ncbi:MAG: alpha/beta hydrolase [Ruminococcaceae bacterium]|nr:alpha/beta hydrolase [Oscillospiraceae bacterium]